MPLDQSGSEFLQQARGFLRNLIAFINEEGSEGHHPPDPAQHQQAMGQGQQGDVNQPPTYPSTASGTLLMAPDGKALFLRRNGTADRGGTWAIPGGMSKDNEMPWQTALRETKEEVGDCGLSADNLQLLDHNNGNGVGYTTYGARVQDAFEPVLNHEHDAYKWATLRDAPQPLHPGLKSTLDFALDPLTEKGSKILKSMQSQYGPDKGKQVFYASINKGNITGAEEGDDTPQPTDQPIARPNTQIQRGGSITPFGHSADRFARHQMPMTQHARSSPGGDANEPLMSSPGQPRTDAHQWPWERKSNDGAWDIGPEWTWERTQKRTYPDGSVDTASFKVSPSKPQMPRAPSPDQTQLASPNQQPTQQPVQPKEPQHQPAQRPAETRQHAMTGPQPPKGPIRHGTQPGPGGSIVQTQSTPQQRLQTQAQTGGRAGSAEAGPQQRLKRQNLDQAPRWASLRYGPPMQPRRQGNDQTGKTAEIEEAVRRSGTARDPQAVAAATRAKMIGREALQRKAAAARSSSDAVQTPATTARAAIQGSRDAPPALWTPPNAPQPQRAPPQPQRQPPPNPAASRDAGTSEGAKKAAATRAAGGGGQQFAAGSREAIVHHNAEGNRHRQLAAQARGNEQDAHGRAMADHYSARNLHRSCAQGMCTPQRAMAMTDRAHESSARADQMTGIGKRSNDAGNYSERLNALKSLDTVLRDAMIDEPTRILQDRVNQGWRSVPFPGRDQISPDQDPERDRRRSSLMGQIERSRRVRLLPRGRLPPQSAWAGSPSAAKVNPQSTGMNRSVALNTEVRGRLPPQSANSANDAGSRSGMRSGARNLGGWK